MGRDGPIEVDKIGERLHSIHFAAVDRAVEDIFTYLSDEEPRLKAAPLVEPFGAEGVHQVVCEGDSSQGERSGAQVQPALAS